MKRLLDVLINHPDTMRSSVVVHKDEQRSDCTSVLSDADVQYIIPANTKLILPALIPNNYVFAASLLVENSSI